MKKVKLLSIALFAGLLVGSASAQQQPCSIPGTCNLNVTIDTGPFSFASLQAHLPAELRNLDNSGIYIRELQGLRTFEKVTSYEKADYIKNYLTLNYFSDVQRNTYLFVKDNVFQNYSNTIDAKLYSTIPAGVYQSYLYSSTLNHDWNASGIASPINDETFRDVYGPIPGIPYYTGIIKKYNFDVTYLFGTLADTKSNTYTNALRRSGFSCVKITTGYGSHMCTKTVGNIRYGWRFTSKDTSDTFVQRL
jgi:hypothetical protein